MPLFAKIKEAYNAMNHLGTGSDQDPLTKMGYYTGRHESRTVRQVLPNVPGFQHPQVDCETGIIERIGLNKRPYLGLKGITGCEPAYVNNHAFHTDAYITFSGSRSGSPENPHGVTILAVPGIAKNNDSNPVQVFIYQKNMTYPILTINDTFVIERPLFNNFGRLETFDVLLEYRSYEDAASAQERGYVGGVCHPAQVEVKLNAFAAIERKRCYGEGEELNVSVSPSAEWQLPENTATPSSSHKASISPSAIAMASVTGVGLVLATPPAIMAASFIAIAGITGIVIGAGALIARNRFKQNNQTEKKENPECQKPAK